MCVCVCVCVCMYIGRYDTLFYCHNKFIRYDIVNDNILYTALTADC